MHYYQFNIADYRKDTGHLTPVEHYIYRWLIDEYHLSEQPFNNNITKLLRKMSLDEKHRNSLELILDEFFKPACDDDYEPVDLSLHPEYADVGEYPETCQYWVHPRIEQDVGTYKKFIDNKSAAGKASAKARKEKSNSRSTSEQLTTNHKPLTNNHKPKEKVKRFKPPSVKEVEQYCFDKEYSIDAEAFIGFYESNGWKVGKNPMKNWKAALTTWQKRNGGNNGSHKQNSKPSLAERATNARREFEQQDNDEPMGEAYPHLRS